MMFRKFLVFILALALLCGSGFSQNDHSSLRNKKVVVLGSSVAAGWVSSYQEKYDMQNGYAYRLARYLEPTGWEVVNISIPGFDTESTIERFSDDVLPLDPGYVIIGLSMSNEGLETMNPDTVFESYRTGILELIKLCRQNNIKPVVGLCYSNDNYTEDQYIYLKRMNRLISSWDTPCINFLGVLDDGHGHFPAGYTFDPNHPDDRGHEEMFYAIVPDLFDALQLEIEDTPFEQEKSDYLFYPEGETDFNEISYIPSDVMHSFTFSFDFMIKSEGMLAVIYSTSGKYEFSTDKLGELVCKHDQIAVLSGGEILFDRAYNLAITQQHLTGITNIYLDGVLTGSIDNQIVPLRFVIGNLQKNTSFRNLRIYRGALNQEEIISLQGETPFDASLEIACLYAREDLQNNKGEIKNYALSLSTAQTDPKNPEKEVQALLEKIEKANTDRANELKVVHRKAIEIDINLLSQYVGSYEIEPNDNLVVVEENNKLYLDDHGRKAEILPYAVDSFFIHYPGDILILFEKDDSGTVIGLTFSINGHEMKARKLSE